MFYQTWTARRPPKWPENAFSFFVILNFYLRHSIQTRPSEGPNTSSLWIWRKSVQRISGSRDISHSNKKVTDSAKNRTLRSSLRAVKYRNNFIICSLGLWRRAVEGKSGTEAMIVYAICCSSNTRSCVRGFVARYGCATKSRDKIAGVTSVCELLRNERRRRSLHSCNKSSNNNKNVKDVKTWQNKNIQKTFKNMTHAND